MADTTGSAPEAVIVPGRERTVDFYGDPIPAAQMADDTIYVPVNPICAHLGLAWAGQYMRLQRDPVLSEALRSLVVTTAGGEQRMQCLPLKFLPGWLFGIQASRVKP